MAGDMDENIEISRPIWATLHKEKQHGGIPPRQSALESEIQWRLGAIKKSRLDWFSKCRFYYKTTVRKVPFTLN